MFLGGCLVPLCALAAPNAADADRALATDLFNQARALVANGSIEEACPRFAESQRLDPSLGTLLNLANCHELEGKLATAWTELNEALALAERERQTERVAFAEAHIAALAPRLPRLVIVVPRELEGMDVAVTRDGSAIARVALGTPMPVDPGVHRIEVTARGHVPWSSAIEIAVGERRELTIGPLTPVQVASPEVPLASTAIEPAAPVVRPEPPAAESHVVALAVGGAGALALGVGVVAGLVAISSSARSDALCSPRCSDEGYALNQEAKTAADVATVSLIVGAAALSVGVLLHVTGRTSKGSKATAFGNGVAPAFRF